MQIKHRAAPLTRMLSLAFLMTLALSPIAEAREGNLELRIQALESRMPDADKMSILEQRLQRIEAGGAASTTGSASSGGIGGTQIVNELEQTQTELRQLRGQIEEMRYELDQIKKSQKQQYLDLDKRITELEKRPVAPATGGTPGGGAAGSGDVMGPPKPQPPSEEEQQTYLAAFDLLKQGRYDDSITAYKAFLEKYPNGEYADNAQYWLGEANYVNRNFDASMQEFQRLVERYPQSDKVPGALLKVGYIQYERKDYNKARAVLQGLTANYPNSSAAGLAFERLERMDREGV